MTLADSPVTLADSLISYVISCLVASQCDILSFKDLFPRTQPLPPKRSATSRAPAALERLTATQR